MKQDINSFLSKKDLVNAFQQIGLTNGDVVEVAINLNELNYIIGKYQAIIEALQQVVGNDGTLVFSYTYKENSEPFKWNGNLNLENVDKVRANILAYNDKRNVIDDPLINYFAHLDSVVSSHHPYHSVFAWGKYASFIVNRHSLHFSYGQDSPSERLLEKKSKFLCLGCGIDRLCATNLAIVKSEIEPVAIQGSKIESNGLSIWKKYLDYDYDNSNYNAFIVQLSALGLIQTGNLGTCKYYIGQIDDLVSEYSKYLENNNFIKYYR